MKQTISDLLANTIHPYGCAQADGANNDNVSALDSRLTSRDTILRSEMVSNISRPPPRAPALKNTAALSVRALRPGSPSSSPQNAANHPLQGMAWCEV
jgi:hypothetical protein